MTNKIETFMWNKDKHGEYYFDNYLISVIWKNLPVGEAFYICKSETAYRIRKITHSPQIITKGF